MHPIVLLIRHSCAIAEAVRIYSFHSFLYQNLTDHADVFGCKSFPGELSSLAQLPNLSTSRRSKCPHLVKNRALLLCHSSMPAYPRPDTKDGRPPQSIIASIRSVLSLRS